MSELKYKQGDKVVIYPWGFLEQKYGLHAGGSIKLKPHFVTSMEHALAGTDRVVNIDLVDDTCYAATFPDGSLWEISDEMILGPAFAWGEEIEVSDDGENWMLDRFCAYTPGATYAIRTLDNSGLFEHARPIRTPELEITVKRDGKELTVDELKELTVEQIKEGLSHG